MENEKMTFKIMDDEGKELECEALFTFESDETGKSYIVYTDNTLDEEGNTKVYAAIYTPEKNEGILQPIESEKEWKIIETIFNEIQEEAKLKSEENEQ
ncbi:MAG: DUF1292 domain-containing protein [Bacilli bacterium]|nr:DUF1292 domain-containing protein [Bacilli bacterium]MDD4282889.1 DUF1292 domain-containing protein [Bacilli bacterium]MDD4718731.1 DUF1292 domain-containing protein [Bacilli bacterium]